MPRQGSSLLKLLKLGAAALQPTKQADGRWLQAAVSAKAAARLRKAALLEGKEWPYEEPRARSQIFQRPPKGHKVDIQAPEREARVQAGLAKQEELLATHAKARARKTSVEAQVAAEWMTRKERIIKGRTSGGPN